MIYAIVAIFLLSSCLLLLALCRTAKLFGDAEPQLVLPSATEPAQKAGHADQEHDKAA